MTFEEALQELEIGWESDPQEIRRSYLRKLKTRKPEVDPEGFRRLREAYDLLTEHAEIIDRVVSAPPAELVVLSSPVAPAEVVPAGFPVAEEAVARFEGVEEEDAEPLVRDAEDRLFHGEPDRALKLLFQAMDAADTEEDLDTPPAERILRILLRFQAQGYLAEADRLQARFLERLRKVPRETDLLDEDDAALWQIAREIAQLTPEFPARMRETIADSIAYGRPGAADQVLERLIAADPEGAREAESQLASLPVLGRLYGNLFTDPSTADPAPERVRKPQQRPSSPLSTLITWAFRISLCSYSLLFLARLFGGPAPPPTEPSVLTPMTLPPPVSYISAEEALQGVCGGDGPVFPEMIEICGAAREVVSGLRLPDCPSARRALKRLDLAIAKAPGPLMNALVDALHTDGARICDDL